MKVSVKLNDLNPVIKADGVLVFDCPRPGCGGQIRVRPDLWKMAGDLSNLTITPSLRSGCWSGTVADGVLTGELL